MTLRALSIAATGGRAMMQKIDTIANNLANVGTTGFKRSRTNFADLLYQQVQRAGFGTPGVNQQPTGTFFGTGVRLVSTEKNFQQGALEETGQPLDLAIEGEGFFRVTLPDGRIAYSRSGNFKKDSEGNMVTSEGFRLEPQITIPDNAIGVSIDQTGLVFIVDPATPDVLSQVGQLEISRFVNPPGLEAVGDNLYLPTPASGPAVDGIPGQGDLGFGSIKQGFLEDSNVDVVRELVDLIQAQRAFEINANSIQAGDEILQTVNNLRR